MQITWLGTAGFAIRTNDRVFLLDPFLSRNSEARPVQDILPADILKAEQIFISHGHFDHIMDVPEIVKKTGAAGFCSKTLAAFLRKKSKGCFAVHPVLKDGQRFFFKYFQAQALFCRHVRFDPKLVLTTLAQMKTKLIQYLPILLGFPCGQVLGWRFFINNRTLLFFGSAGDLAQELPDNHLQTDILLLPLQGHSDICTIGLSYIRHFKPKTVIVHHHDNFYPPISRMVDITPFLEDAEKLFPRVNIIVPQINSPIFF